jgi:RNA polymerase sigma-70 factor (ECF subfamily)
MRTGSNEELFERFRAGDAAALGELFDLVAPSLLRIAIHLAKDPAQAEDLLQSTFLTAIEARGQWDGRRPIVPWLCGILQNRARSARRREARELPPLRLGEATAADPAEVAESKEFSAAVDKAIGDLPPHYRIVLRLHLRYGHAPAEIAHALGRSPSTVRSQLARGLQWLRRSLPAGLASAIGSSLLTGRGVAAVRDEVMTAASTIFCAGGSSTAIIGGALVLKQFLGAAALFALGCMVWLELAGPRTEPTAAMPAQAMPARAAESPPGIGATWHGSGGAGRVEAPMAADPGTGSLRVRCHFAEDRSPAAGVLVAITPNRSADRELEARSVWTAADGTALLEDLPEGEYSIESDRGGTTRASVTPASIAQAELAIPVGVLVRGRVMDSHRTPVPSAWIWLSSAAGRYWEGRQPTKCDRAGRFELRSVEPGRFISAHARGFSAAVVKPIEAGADGTAEIELVLPSPGAVLEGLVLDASSRPLADALVLVGARAGDLAWNARIHEQYRPPVDLRTDADGRFLAAGMLAGRIPVWVRAPGHCIWYGEPELPAVGDQQLRIVMGRGATVHGVVTDARGEPIAGAWIRALARRWFRATGEFDGRGSPSWARLAARSASDGTYSIALLPPEETELRAGHQQIEVREVMHLTEGQRATWNPVLLQRRIRGRVLDANGFPMPGLQVRCTPPRGQGSLCVMATDPSGRFESDPCLPVPYRIDVIAPNGAGIGALATVRGLAPDGGEVEIRIPSDALPSARLEGNAADSTGRPLAKAKVWIATATADSRLRIEVEDSGRFRSSLLPPGEYRIQLAAAGDRRRAAWSQRIRLSASELRDVGRLVMPETGSIELMVADSDGQPLDGVAVSVTDDYGWGEDYWSAGRTERGQLRIDELAPGTRQLWIQPRNGPEFRVDVAVAAGQLTTRSVRTPPGVRCNLVLEPVTEPVPIHVRFDWSLDGKPWRRYVNWIEGQGEAVWPQHLVPGSHEVTITSETGKQVVTRFWVRPTDQPDREIRIRLP